MNCLPDKLANRSPGARSSAFSLCRILVAVALTIAPAFAQAAVPSKPTINNLIPYDGWVWLGWTTSNNATTYEYSSDDGSSWTSTTAVGLGITNLTNGQDYTFKVRACNNDGCSASDERKAYPTAGPAAPTVGGIVTLTAVPGHKRMKLSWANPGNASITKYQYSVDSVGYNDFTDIPGSGAATTEYTVARRDDGTGTSLNNGTNYKFAVRAVDANGGGAFATASATPVLTAPTGKPSMIVAPSLDGGRYIQVNWGPPSTDFPDPAVDDYELGIKEAGANAFDWITSTTNNYRFEDLTNFTAYTVAVKACNSKGCGPPNTKNATPTATVPSEPRSFRAPPGDGQVTLNWIAPEHDGGENIIRYEYEVDDSNSWVSVNLNLTTTVTGLTNGTEYDFAVRAVNVVGNSDEATASATPNPLPAAPTGLTATASIGQVELSWDDPNNDSIHRWEYRWKEGNDPYGPSITVITGSNATTTSHTVTGLDNGTEYTFALRARNKTGPSSWSSKTVIMVPAAPAGLAATPDDAEVTLTWTDPDNDSITKYEVSSDGGGSFAEIAASDKDTTGHTVTGLTNGTEYDFAVRAVNASGDGVEATASATPNPVPAAPANLTATASVGQVALSWDNPDNDSITGYEVRRKAGTGAFGNWSAIANSGAGTTSHDVTGLTNGTAYTFELRAENATGDGAASSAGATPLFAAPTDFDAEPGDTQVTLTWDDPDDTTITGYQLSTDDGAWTAIAGSSASTTEHTVTGLTNGTAYAFKLRAVNGAESEERTATPLFAAPTDFDAEPGDTQVTLTWDDPDDATITGYQLSTDDGAWTAIAGSSASTTEHTVTGLTNGTAYAFKLRAVNGAESEERTATPNPAPAAPTGLTATGGDGAVTLDWSDPDNDSIIGYEIRRQAGTGAFGNWTAMAGSGAGTTSHDVTGLTNGTAYTFELRAVNATGDGAASSAGATPVAAADDTQPSLAAVAAQSYTRGVAIATLTLPAASGGNGTLTYSLSPSPPAGLAFDASARTLSGTPTAVRAAVEHTYTARDADGDAASRTFTIEVRAPLPAAPTGLAAAGGDGAVTLSWADPGDDSITGYDVRQKAGALDWGDWTEIGSSDENTTSHTVTGLTNGTAYTFEVRAVNATGDGAASSAGATPVAAADDTQPSLAAVAAQSYTRGVAIETLTLPAASGGNGTLTYSLSPSPPAGLAFDAPARTLSGTPTAVRAAVEHTYTARDADGDEASRTFTIEVRAPLPAAPSGLAAAGGDGAVTLSWADPGDDSITGYDVRQKAGALDWGAWAEIGSSDENTTSHTVTGLTNGTAYTFEVRAVNATGDGAASSAGATPVAASDDTQPSLAAVAAQSYTRGVAIATLTLPAASGGNGTLTYSLSPSPPAGLAFDGSARTLSGTPTAVRAGVEHTYTARDADGDEASRTFTIEVRAPLPAAPTGLAAAGGDGAVTLSWADPGDDSITGYDVRQKAGALDWGAWAEIGNSDENTTSHTVTGLTNGTAYTFEVRAVNATGAGAASSAGATPVAAADDTQPSLAAVAAQSYTRGVAIETLTLPAASGGNGTLTYSLSPSPPAGLAFDASARTLSGTPTAVRGAVEHTYTARDADGDAASRTFTIEVRAPLPAAPTGLAAAGGDGAVTLSWADPGDDSITGYDVRQKAGAGEFGDWTEIGSSDENTTSHTVTGLTNGTAYTFELRAVNATGDGAASSAGATPVAAADDTQPSLAAVDDQIYTAGEEIDELTLPAASGGNGTLTYSLSEDEDLPTGLTFNASARTLSGTPTETQAATDYTYTATDADGDTASRTFSIEVRAPLPAAPAGLTATASDAQVTLSWSDPGDDSITGYDVRQQAGAGEFGDWTEIGNSDENTTSHTVTGLANGTAYTFEVRAVNATGDGAASSAGATPVAASDDTQPSLAAIDDQSYTRGVAIETLTLPAASGGNGTLTYSLSPAPPAGLTFNSEMRTLSGTPTAVRGAVEHTYTARDADGDEASRTFTIEVRAPLPAAPTGLAATGGDGAVTLSWADPGDDSITGYDVRQKAGALDWGDWTEIGSSDENTTSHTVTGLTNGTAYTFEVWAVNATGDGAASSAGATPVAAADDTQPSLAAVAAQSYTRGVAIATLTLPAASGGNGTLTYSLSPSPPAGLAFNGSARTLSGTPTAVRGAVEHTYTARDADGDEASRTFTIEVRAPLPAAPTGLAATGGDGAVTLSWADPGDDSITGYDVRQKAGALDWGDWTEIGSSDENTTSHTVTGLANGTAYTFEVRAVNATGDGAASSAGATPVAAADDTQPSLAAVDDQIYTAGEEIDELTLPASSSGNGTLTYSLSPAPPAGLTFNSEMRTLGGKPTETQDATEYTYTAKDADNDTASRTFTIEVRAPLPAAPTGLTATGGDGAVTLSWSDPGDDSITGYDVRQKAGALDWGAWAEIGNSDENTTSHTVTGLTNGTAYTFEVRAVNATGDGAASSAGATPVAAADDTQPSLAAVAAQSYTRGVAIETLTLPAASGGNGTLTYSLSPSPPAGLAFDGSARTLSGTPTAVRAAVEHTYTARDADGDEASRTFTIEVRAPLPAAPTGLTAAGGDGAVTLSWADPGDDSITGYDVRQKAGALDWGDWTEIGSSDENTTSHTVTGLTNGTAYRFELRAVNATGDGAASSAGATPVAAADDTQPSLAAIAAQSYTRGVAIETLTLPAASGGNGTLTYSLSPSPPVGLAFNASARTLGGTPTETQAATDYTYTATDADGDTASRTFSIEVRAPLPAAPAGLTATASDAQVTLSWADPGDDSITGYDVRQQAGAGEFGDWTEIGSSDENTTSHTVTGLTNGTAYRFELRAVNATGDGAASSAGATPVAAADDTQPSLAAVAAQSYTRGVAIATLTLPAASGGNGTLTYSLSPSPPAGLAFDASARTLSGTPTAVRAAVEHTYTARDADGDEASRTFTIEVRAPLPAAPTGLAATGGDGAVTLSWSDPGDDSITGYDVRQKAGALDWGAWTEIGSSDENTTSHTVTGLTNGTAYTFEVRAVNATGDGAASSAGATPVAASDDTQPSLAAVAAQSYTRGVAIATLTLPAASGGNGTLTYSLSPSPPAGLAFDGSARTLSGTPTAVRAAVEHTYTARDADGDAASRTFTIEVRAPLPAAPTGLTAAGGDGAVTLSWADPGDDSITGYDVRQKAGALDWGAWTEIGSSDENTTSHTVTGLTNGTAYTFEVRAVNATGDGAASSAGATPVAASDDTQPSLAAIDDQSYTRGVAIETLTLPAASGGNGTLTYSLSPAPPAGLTFNSEMRTLSGTPTAVRGAVEHTYTARDADGDEASRTFTIEVRAPLPAAPTGLTATGGDGAVTLSWADPGDDSITGYDVRQKAGALDWGDWTEIGSSDENTTSHTVTGLTNGTAYTFEVRAVNATGDGAASSAGATPVAAADDTQPSLAAVAAQSYTRGVAIATLTLPAASGGNGTLTYSLSPSPPAGLAFDGSARTLSGTPTAVRAGVEHTYTARDADGDEASRTFTIEVRAPLPAAPTGLTAAGGDGAVTLSWADPGDDSITGYDVRQKAGAGEFGDWTEIGSSDENTTSHTVTGLTNGTAYTFEVRAVNATGDGAASSAGATPVAAADDTQPSLAAVAVQSYTRGVAIATLTLPAASGGNGTLTYSLSPSPPAGLAFDGSARTLSGTPTAVRAAVEHTYTARDADGDEASRTFTIEVRAPLPAAPTGLAATGGDGAVTLSWADPGDDSITGYDVRQKAGALDWGAWTEIGSSDENTTSHTVTGLTNGTAYTFEVRAVNATGDGAASSAGATPVAASDDTQPSLAAVAAQSYTRGVAIETLTLPAASGGNGTLTYSLSPSPPAGLAFDGSARTLSGTPTAVRAGVEHTYTARDADGDEASRTFTIEVRAPLPAAPTGLTATGGDGAVTLSWADPGDDSITGYDVRQKAGALDWGDWTEIGSSDENTTSHTVTGLTNGTAYTFELRAVNATGDGAASSAGATPVAAADDTQPSLAAVDDQIYTAGEEIDELTLPAASGGNGTLTYSLSEDEDLPTGLTFNASARTLSGTPTETQAATDYTYTATDADGDTASRTFSIEVRAPLPAAPAGLTATASDAQVTLSWSDPGDDSITGYDVRQQVGAGEFGDWTEIGNSDENTTSHTVTGLANGTAYTFEVRAVNATGDGAASSAGATPVAASDDTQPSLAAIDDQSYTRGVAIETLTLPAASGGNGTLTYSLSPAPPAGLTFNSEMRTLSGTPTAVRGAVEHTYTARDADGDEASRTFTIEVRAPLPAAPTGLAATGGDGAVTLSWADPGDDSITGYDVRQKAGALDWGDWTEIGSSDENTTSHTVTGLTNGTAYTFEVRAVNATGDGAASSAGATPVAASDDTQPSLAAVAAQSYTRGVAIATLTLPAASGGNGTLTYSLSPSPPAGLAFNGSARTLSGTPTAVRAAVEHTYTARDADGDEASRTFTIEVRAPLPAAPTGLTATGGDGAVTLSWADPGDDSITGYDVRQQAGAGEFGAWTEIGNSDENTTSHTVTGLANGTAYTFEVRAVNATGDGAASSAGATPVAASDDTQPSLAAIDDQIYTAGEEIDELTLPASSSGNGTLTYSLSEDEDLPTGLTFNASARTLSGTPTETQAATEYTYTAMDADGDTASRTFSIEVRAPLPAAPAGLTATASDAQVTLSWSDPGDDSITGYDVRQQAGAGEFGDWTEIGNSDENTTSHTVTGLTNGTAYTFEVRAVNATGDGAASSAGATPVAASDDTQPSLAAIDDQIYTAGEEIDELTLPASSTGNGELEYSLSGDEGLPTGLTFDVETRTLSGTPTETQAAVEYTYTAKDADNDTASRTFTIEVRESALATAPPAAPTDLAATAGDAQVTLSWSDPGDDSITRYEVRQKAGALDWGAWTEIGSSDENTTSHTVTGLTNGTAYTFEVRAVNATGDGAASSAGATPVAAADDTQPSLAAIDDQIYTAGEEIDELTLPAASGGNGTLTYSLSEDEDLPTGLTFDVETRTLSGTPTETQAATEYTYTATDADGDAASRTFTIEVRAALPAAPTGLTATASDAQVTLSWSDPGDDSITGYDVRQKAGALDWGDWTEIGSSDENTTSHTVTGLTNGTAYTFEVRAVNATGDGAASSAGATPVAASDDTQPSLAAIDDQIYTAGEEIDELTLPASSSGNGTLTYSLSPAPPAGLTFNSEMRTLGGKPTETQDATEYTYTAKDADNDTASRTFTIEVRESALATAPPAAPTDLAATAGDAQVTLEWADPGDDSITRYEVRQKAGALDWGAWTEIGSSDENTTSHTVTGLANGTAYTFEVRAVNATGDGAASSAGATPVAASDDTQPSLAAVAAQSYTRGVAIATLTLPAASGGNGTLTYSLSPSPPAGLAFNGSARTLSGTPTAVRAAVEHTYTARDADGDEASRTFTIEVRAPLPAAPTGLTATGGDGAVTLSWADPGDDSITGYDVRQQAGAGEFGDWTEIGNSDENTTSHTVTGLANGTAYTFEVRAVNATGDGAASSAGATPVAASDDTQPSLAAIDDQIYTAGEEIDELTLPASSSGNGTLTYSLSEDEDLPTGLTFNASARTLSGTPTETQAATEYTYTAMDADGDTASRTFSIEVRAPLPAAPAGLTATASDAQVTLSWSDPGDDSITGYDVRQQAGAGEFGDWTEIGNSDENTTSHTVTGLTNGTAYTFEVRAVNATGDGAASSAGATPVAASDDTQPSLAAIDDQIYTAGEEIDELTLPASSTGNGELEYSLSGDEGLPTGLTFDVETRTLSGTPTETQAAVEYTYTAKDADNDTASRTFTIEVRESALATAPPAAPTDLAATAGDAQVTLSWSDPGDDSITRYEVRQKAGALDWGAWTEIGSSDENTTSHTVTGLTNGTAYTFEVRAVNATGDGAASSAGATPVAAADDTQPSLAAIDDQIYTAGEEIDELTLPAASGGNGTLTYSLSEDEDLPTGLTFDVETRTLSGTPTETQAATEYTYTATDADGDAASRTFTIEVRAALPAAPTGLTATASDAQVTLSWSDPGDDSITGYDVRQKAGALDWGDWTEIGSSDENTTSHTVTGLTNGTAYTFEVRAVNATGDGAASSAGATPVAASDDTQPSLAAIDDQIYTAGEEIDELTLPASSSGNGTLTYSLSPAPPAGLTFNSEMRTLGGKPTETQDATEYTYTAKDADNDTASRTFTIEVRESALATAPPAAPTDLAATAGDAQVTLEWADPGDDSITRYEVRQKAGALDWGAWTEIGSSDENTTSHTVTGLANGTAYTFEVRAVNATGAGAASSAGATPVAAADDTQPSLAAIDDQIYTAGEEIDELTLPASSTGNGELEYSLSGDEGLPTGLTFDVETRTLSGTPTETQAAVEYTYTARDADGDAASRTFTIEVTEPAPALAELKVNFGQRAYTMMEGQQSDIEVRISPTADRQVEVPLLVMPKGGATDEDYNVVPAKVMFQAGESDATISVTVLADEMNDPGEAIVLSFNGLPDAVGVGDISQTTVNLGDRQMAEQFSQTLEVTEAVIARSMAESVQTAIQGRFERYRQRSRFGPSVGALSPQRPESDNRVAAQGSGKSKRTGSGGGGGKGAEGPAVQRVWGADKTSAATESGWNTEDRRTGKPRSWLRSFTLGPLGNFARSDQAHLSTSPGSGMSPSGGVYAQDRQYDSRVGATPLGSDSGDFSGTRDLRLSLSEVSFEMSRGESETDTGWIPVLWGQGDLQHFNGDSSPLGMSYRGGLEAAHLGLDLHASEQMLAGLSFMRSRGDLDYTVDGVDGVVESRMNTIHPYLYWQPNERVGVWGIGGLGTGQVDVEDPDGTHDFDADFRMFAGGVRAVLSRRDNNEWGLRADGFTAQLQIEASEDIDKVSGEAHRGRLMLEWVHAKELSAHRSLSVRAEAGGRFDGGDADRGAGVETGVLLGSRDASHGLDVALRGRVLVVHESDYRDWGVGLQASWDPGAKQRGFRVSAMSSWGRDGEDQTTLWDNGDAVIRPAGTGAMGMGSRHRMESELAYAGVKAPGLPGLLTPYGRLRWDGQGRELNLGTAWSPSAAGSVMLELEATRRETRTRPADLELLLRVSIPLDGS